MTASSAEGHARALFLVFDFGGVITANAFPAMQEYSQAMFHATVREEGAAVATAASCSADVVQEVAGALVGSVKNFFSAVNKYNSFTSDAGESEFERMERGVINRADYCAAFPAHAEKCVEGLYVSRAQKVLLKKFPNLPEGDITKRVEVATALMHRFRKRFDIETLMSILERSPLRRNVVELLDFVRRSTYHVQSPCPVRLGLITNNWQGMGVDEGLQLAIEYARSLASQQKMLRLQESATLADGQAAESVPPAMMLTPSNTDKAATAAAAGAGNAPQGPKKLFDVVVESHKEGERKPNAALFLAAAARLTQSLPGQPDDKQSQTKCDGDFWFFDDLKPNVAGAMQSRCVTRAVHVSSSRAVFEGVTSALRSVGHVALADTVVRKFAKSFPEAVTVPDSVPSPRMEDEGNAMPLPPPPVPNLLPTHMIPAKQRFSPEELHRLMMHLGASCPSYFPLQLKLMAEGGPPMVEYFKGGMSNPTFRVTVRTGSFVLRKQPKGKLLAGAHDVRREYLIMRHLRECSGGRVPVPHVLHFCEDKAILGTPFYVMKFVEGDIIRRVGTLIAQPHPRRIIGGLIDALAALHKAGPPVELVRAARPGVMDAPGPSDPHPLLRVVQTWSKQYARGNRQLLDKSKQGAKVEPSFDVPEFVELGERLTKLFNAPKPNADGSAGTRLVPTSAPTLVHGDYKPDNMIIAGIHSAKPRIVALLDFELAHISDPLADLGYFCLLYVLPSPRGVAGLEGVDRLPAMADVIEQYCSATGALADMDAKRRRAIVQVYMAAACHKLSGIVHGVVVRAMIGNASDVQGGLKMADLCQGCSMLGLGLLDEAAEAMPGSPGSSKL